MGQEPKEPNSFPNHFDIGMSTSQFERIVAGSVKSTIDAHGKDGYIHLDDRSSIAKRVVSSVHTYFKDFRRRQAEEIKPCDLSRKNKMVYLASPYNHENALVRSYRYKEAVIATSSLMAEAICVHSPIVHNHKIALYHDLGRGFDFWKKQDETILRRCDALLILVIPDWASSVGVSAETELAEQSHIPIFYLSVGVGFYHITRRLDGTVYHTGQDYLRVCRLPEMPIGTNV